MMNSSSSAAVGTALNLPVTAFLYRDMSAGHGKTQKAGEPAADRAGEAESPSMSAQELQSLLTRARQEAAQEAEKRLRKEYEERAQAEAGRVHAALELFAEQQMRYFSRVESELVQLSLAIAAKILHREAQVDPMLLAALVKVALEKLNDGSSVTVRVAQAEAARWRAYLASTQTRSSIELVEDAALGPQDCVLETTLGLTNFNIEAQLKEVEQGFFDLLAQRPVIG